MFPQIRLRLCLPAPRGPLDRSTRLAAGRHRRCVDVFGAERLGVTMTASMQQAAVCSGGLWSALVLVTLCLLLLRAAVSLARI